MPADGVVGNLVDAPAAAGSLRVLRRADAVWRLDRDVLVGLLVSTEHLTVGTVTVPAGHTSLVETHDGEELLYVTRGALRVEAGGVDAALSPGDAFFVPSGTPHRYAADDVGVAEGDLRSRAEVRAAGGLMVLASAAKLASCCSRSGSGCRLVDWVTSATLRSGRGPGDEIAVRRGDRRA